jgi:hypothetical protein
MQKAWRRTDGRLAPAVVVGDEEGKHKPADRFGLGFSLLVASGRREAARATRVMQQRRLVLDVAEKIVLVASVSLRSSP